MAERAAAFWPNKGSGGRSARRLGAPYRRLDPIAPVAPAVPASAPECAAHRRTRGSHAPPGRPRSFHAILPARARLVVLGERRTHGTRHVRRCTEEGHAGQLPAAALRRCSPCSLAAPRRCCSRRSGRGPPAARPRAPGGRPLPRRPARRAHPWNGPSTSPTRGPATPAPAADRNPLDVSAGGQRGGPAVRSVSTSPARATALHVGLANQVARDRTDGLVLRAPRARWRTRAAPRIGAGNSTAFPADATLRLSPDAVSRSGTRCRCPAPDRYPHSARSPLRSARCRRAGPDPGPRNRRRAAPATRSAACGSRSSSPALGAALSHLADAAAAPTRLPRAAVGAARVLGRRSKLLSPLPLDGGAAVADPEHPGPTLTLDVLAVLRDLGADLNRLPANTDLDAFLARYLAAPEAAWRPGCSGPCTASSTRRQAQGLRRGVPRCPLAAMLPAQLRPQARAIMARLVGGQQQLQSTRSTSSSDRLAAAGGANPLAPLADGLRQALDPRRERAAARPGGQLAAARLPTRPMAGGCRADDRPGRRDRPRRSAGRSAEAAALALASAAAGPSRARRTGGTGATTTALRSPTARPDTPTADRDAGRCCVTRPAPPAAARGVAAARRHRCQRQPQRASACARIRGAALKTRFRTAPATGEQPGSSPTDDSARTTRDGLGRPSQVGHPPAGGDQPGPDRRRARCRAR